MRKTRGNMWMGYEDGWCDVCGSEEVTISFCNGSYDLGSVIDVCKSCLRKALKMIEEEK